MRIKEKRVVVLCIHCYALITIYGDAEVLYYNNIDDLELENPSVVTLGKFDGMHLGHRKLINRVKEISSQRNLNSVMFTFDAPPKAKIENNAYKTIFTKDEKRMLAEKFGIDVLVECPFSESIRNMSADDFICNILLDKIHAKAVVAGTDFRFGKNRQGDAKYLIDNAEKFGFTADIIEKETDESGRDISSTFVREELEKGNIEKANSLLGFDYFISGKIISGMHLGRNLGFPTINITPSSEKLLPPNGVYASFTEINGKTYGSISNIGVKPTVGGTKTGVETFVLDFNEDIYGMNVSVKLCEFMRPEKKFESVDELKTRVYSDIERRKEKL